jgi:hypothetical protein
MCLLHNLNDLIISACEDKDIIARKQVFPAFSASILVNSYFTSLAEIWRSEDCLLTLQLEIKKTRNGRRKIIGFRAYRGQDAGHHQGDWCGRRRL